MTVDVMLRNIQKPQTRTISHGKNNSMILNVAKVCARWQNIYFWVNFLFLDIQIWEWIAAWPICNFVFLNKLSEHLLKYFL